MKKLTIVVMAVFTSLLCTAVDAQNISEKFRVDGVMFLSFEHDMTGDSFHNQFTIKRGYVNFRSSLTDKINVRITQDVTIDEEGDGLGDIELRLKYAYVEYDLPSTGLFNEPLISGGVTSRPWISFEQDVNDYRSQKSMFMDQNDILSSADYGLAFETGFGESLDAPGLSSNDSKYGSFAIGVYNGGGYSAIEVNNNKLVEGRLSLRPAHNIVPGFQVNVFGAFGKGNSTSNPEFNLLGSALTYESVRANMVLQGFQSVGDQEANFVNPAQQAYELQGWSIFTEFQPLADLPIHINARTEELTNLDQNRWVVRESVIGIAYVFPNRSKIILDYSHRESRTEFNPTDFSRVEVIGEIRF
ncbi:hypothetical protein [Gracilimonas mengyeensis]|uniref:Phosphate-selective porin O and P n=1 Tax=Gracilimonas mengyeensis TaxID=1302730 RepID=A0A521E5D0_9BACT|nr:hypothetical protein [Gracilimonas mengyeensis]SMO79154.1 hypothetical protein SAMN06265219_110171 [Gracilimonas mengyeensis]